MAQQLHPSFSVCGFVVLARSQKKQNSAAAVLSPLIPIFVCEGFALCGISSDKRKGRRKKGA